MLWIVVVAALVAAAVGAVDAEVREARAGGEARRRRGEVTARPDEDPAAAEMRRITEQLREQGRG